MVYPNGPLLTLGLDGVTKLWHLETEELLGAVAGVDDDFCHGPFLE